LNANVEAQKYFWLQPAITPYRSEIPVANRIFTTWQFKTATDADRYQALFETVPGLYRIGGKRISDAICERNRFTEGRGRACRSFPRRLRTTARQESVLGFTAAVGRSSSGGGRPVIGRAGSHNSEQCESFTQELLAFLRGEYSAHAPETVGELQYPEGKEYYRFLVRRYTTMDVTPEQVHQTGIEEVKRLNEPMAEMRTSLGFHGSKAEFHAALKKDPLLRENTGGRPGKVDGVRPPDGAKHRRVFPDQAESAVWSEAPRSGARRIANLRTLRNAQRYGADRILLFQRLGFRTSVMGERERLDVSRTDTRSSFSAESAKENEKLPRFRRESYHTASGEGWGEYSSALREEMGPYKDLYNRYGRLAMEMFLAVRLVVDTGMNYFGWSRGRAIDFMQENVLESEGQIATERSQ
jgi:uncharacterized protein (DUF885 family)